MYIRIHWSVNKVRINISQLRLMYSPVSKFRDKCHVSFETAKTEIILIIIIIYENIIN